MYLFNLLTYVCCETHGLVCRYSCFRTTLLDVGDKMFATIGAAFIKEVRLSSQRSDMQTTCKSTCTYVCHVQVHLRTSVFQYTAEFGTDHVYNADTFNEMTPKSK